MSKPLITNVDFGNRWCAHCRWLSPPDFADLTWNSTVASKPAWRTAWRKSLRRFYFPTGNEISRKSLWGTSVGRKTKTERKKYIYIHPHYSSIAPFYTTSAERKFYIIYCWWLYGLTHRGDRTDAGRRYKKHLRNGRDGVYELNSRINIIQ